MSVDPQPRSAPATSGVRVELFCHQGCPNAEPTRILLRECLIEAGLKATVIDRVGAYPSPTVLVNGRDVMGGGVLSAGVAACRLHLPTRERVRAVLLGIQPLGLDPGG